MPILEPVVYQDWEDTPSRKIPARYIEYSRGNRRNRKPLETIHFKIENGVPVPASFWDRAFDVIRAIKRHRRNRAR